ncbi:MAG: serine/threonine-protein kinase [Gallionellaceae bacterium]
MAKITQLGRYEVISEIGQGAMGIVYKARDPLIDRIVAIKTINLGLALDEKEEYEGRFYQEAKAAGRLSHPNIVTIYDVGKNDEVAYIAMEFLQGREIRDILNQGVKLPTREVLDIAVQIAQGLDYAHEHGIVHRDVKPSNIMMIRDGHIKITDFGIARMESASVRTQTGMVLGSPKYMSPEQVMGKQIDARSDIFSLGVMLYEMLTGKAPFTGENVNAIMYQTLNGVPPPPSSVDASMPEMLNFIVAKALAKNVDDRYQSAKELAGDLRVCRDQLAPVTNIIVTPDQVMSDRRHVARSDENGDPLALPTIGLSPAFDSASATMRLAALTASGEVVDELSKTFKMARPTLDEIKKAGAKAIINTPVSTSSAPDSAAVNKTLLVIVMLITIGLVVALLN